MSTTTLSIPLASAELDLPNSETPQQDSIFWWLEKYWNAKVEGAPAGTVDAKKDDLQHFFDFFGVVVGTDQVDFWTPVISRNFKSWLLSNEPDPDRQHNQAFAPATVNRKLATVRHFAKYIQANRNRPFAGGYPLEDVKDIKLKNPKWNGLERIQVIRLQAALDQLIQLSTRKNQRPRMLRSVFSISISLGLRASELAKLNFDQVQGNYLVDVWAKAENYYDDKYIPAGPRKDLFDYIEHERGREPGPLYCTKSGGRFGRDRIYKWFRRIESQANSRLPENEQIRLHPHKLRHTSIKQKYDKEGPVEAKEHGGHKSFAQLSRYASRTQAEREAAADEAFPA